MQFFDRILVAFDQFGLRTRNKKTSMICHIKNHPVHAVSSNIPAAGRTAVKSFGELREYAVAGALLLAVSSVHPAQKIVAHPFL